MPEPSRGSSPDSNRESKEIISKEKFPLPEEYKERLAALGLESHIRAYDKVLEVIKAMEEAGGIALLVGGSVRDVLFGKVSKDYDIEVYGLSAAKIEEITKAHGKINKVGASFGVLKLSFGEDVDVDISLPRKDSKTGKGHTGFDVKTDPNMSIADAALRRDFTMNTVAANPFTGEIFDPHGGIKDIKERRLRVTDHELFADDPLRVMRGVQFIARFGLEIDPKSMQIMQEMIPRLHEISSERFLVEWEKLLLKAEKPSMGLSAAMTLGVMREMYPQFLDMKENGDPDAWIHTLASVDESAKITRREELGKKEAFILMLGALCGNLVTGDTAGGRKSEKQPDVDVGSVKKFLTSIKIDNKTRNAILALIPSRLVPQQMFVNDQLRGSKVTDGQIRRLADQIHPATIQDLVLLAETDHLGRNAFAEVQNPETLLMPSDSFPAREWLLKRAKELGIEEVRPGNIIRGQDLLNFGFKPGRHLGQMIALANDLRDEQDYARDQIFQAIDGILDPDQAIKKLEKLLATT